MGARGPKPGSLGRRRSNSSQPDVESGKPWRPNPSFVGETAQKLDSATRRLGTSPSGALRLAVELVFTDTGEVRPEFAELAQRLLPQQGTLLDAAGQPEHSAMAA